MKLKIAVFLPGDGIGPEVTNEAIRHSACCGGTWRTRLYVHAGADRWSCDHGSRVAPCRRRPSICALDSDAVFCWVRWVITSLRRFRRTSVRRPGLLAIRQALGGFANLRPSIAYEALSANSPLRPEVTRGADISVRTRTAGRPLLRRSALVGSRFGREREHDALYQA